jgi:UDP:flavonoid glycosyltransferase YjiC (YdhE family)
VRVLFASTQGAGHFGPLIPFIDSCLTKGHEVLIVGPPTLKARGYPFEAGAVPPDEILGPLWAAMPSLPPGQGDVVVVGEIFARLNVDAMLATLEEAIEDWRPDLVVREASEFASAIAADIHGVRHVRVSIGVGLVEAAALGLAEPALDERRSGIVERIAASPYLTFFPPSVDPPLFDVTRFRHPGVDGGTTSLPDRWPGDEQPLVYASFGSVAATFPPAAQVYASLLAAVADLPVRVLLTTGGNEIELGEVPQNVHLERWVSEPEILGHASAMVGHGGSGTTLSALAAGCPLVSVPLFGDQPMNAARVAAAGAGVVATVTGIGGGITRVLEHERYAAAAVLVADEMRSQAPVDTFLDPFA